MKNLKAYLISGFLYRHVSQLKASLVPQGHWNNRYKTNLD